MQHDRTGTTTDAVWDIFGARLPVEELRKRYAAGKYGKVNPQWIAGWLKLRGG